MPTKKYDVVTKIGTYEVNGEQKNRYLNVGTILENDGKEFMILNRTFNPAGIPNPENRSTIILSFFEPKKLSEESKQATIEPKDVQWEN